MSNPLGRRTRPTTDKLDRAAFPGPIGIPGAEKTDVVSTGDTLQSLARQHYGNPLMWTTIFTANQGKVSNGRLIPGQVLVIPNG